MDRVRLQNNEQYQLNESATLTVPHLTVMDRVRLQNNEQYQLNESATLTENT